MPQTPENLIQAFNDIRQTFFPRWDRGHEWTIAVVDDLDGSVGQCNAPAKRIELAILPKNNELTAWIIHEIAHAAAEVCHGKRWLARMERAAEDAESLGRDGLTAVLREQIQGYRDAFKITAAMIYGELEDAVISQPQTSFHQALDFVRRDHGLSREEFLRRFRRSQAVYDEAWSQAQEYVRRRAEWQAGRADSARPCYLTPVAATS